MNEIIDGLWRRVEDVACAGCMWTDREVCPLYAVWDSVLRQPPDVISTTPSTNRRGGRLR
jgi:hypothetical protein